MKFKLYNPRLFLTCNVPQVEDEEDPVAAAAAAVTDALTATRNSLGLNNHRLYRLTSCFYCFICYLVGFRVVGLLAPLLPC